MSHDPRLENRQRRRLLAAVGGVLIGGTAAAQDRGKPATDVSVARERRNAAVTSTTPRITLIVPTPAGNSTDRVGRVVAGALSTILEVPVRVDNVPGNSGVIGLNAIAASANDGSVLGLVTSTSLIGGKLLSRSARFSPVDDFEWLAILGTFPTVMVVAAGSGYDGLDEWLAAARRAPKPLVYGSVGGGSAGHLAGAYLRYEQGANLSHRTVESLDEGHTLLVDGKIDVLFEGVPSLLPGTARSGQRIVAVTSAKRVASMPNIPAFGELWDNAFEVWIGLVAPKELDKRAYIRLAPAVGVMLAEPAHLDAMRAGGLQLLGLTGDSARSYMEHEFVRNAKLIARLNDEGRRN